MPQCEPTQAQQYLLDRIRGHLSFMAFPHPEWPGWVWLVGRRELAGLYADTTYEVLQAARQHAAAVCKALLEAKRPTLSSADDHETVHLIQGPRTDCGLPAKDRRGTFNRREATCCECLGEKPAPELYVDAEWIGRQGLAGKVLVSVDPSSDEPGVTVHLARSADAEEAAELGQVDPFLMGVADIASATRDLAEAHRAVSSSSRGGDEVEELIEDIAKKLRARVQLLAVTNGES